MDLKQLKALVTVVETGSVTRAAELLHLVQPAVTRQIRALEHELGVPLFDRTHQGMRPTKAGAALADRARRALTELDRARAELTPAAGAVTGIVTVGLLESAAELLAEPLARTVLRDHSGIELRIQTAYSGHLQQWLDDGDLDLSLLYNLTGSPSLNATPLVREQLWAVAPASFGLDPKEPVRFAEVAAHPIIMPSPGHGLHALITGAARRAGAELDTAIQTNSMSLQKQLVRSGQGWTILPAVGIAGDLDGQALSAAPLCAPEVRRSIALGTPRSGRVPAAVELVGRVLVDHIRAAVQNGRWPSAVLQDEQ